MEFNGIIMKAISGFYYVKTTEGTIECKARGVFRKEKITPLVGDKVKIQVDENNKGFLIEIYPRKNELQRPPVANIDQLFVVVSTTEPKPNLPVTDKLIAIAEHNNIEPILIISKADCQPQTASELNAIYAQSGFQCFTVDSLSGEGVTKIAPLFAGKVSAFSGNSGVGKSTLLNALEPSLSLDTGEISSKLGRGRHTTRQVSLFPVLDGYVADTPGFASLELENTEFSIDKDELPFCFREFVPLLGTCKFSTCTHVSDKGCAILAAIEAGEIRPERHESYVAMYETVKNFKPWMK